MAREQSSDFFSNLMFGNQQQEMKDTTDLSFLLNQMDEIIGSIEQLAPILIQLAPLLDLFIDKK
ncbi:hypothetical protein FZC66_15650 [Priestia megaterium]|nr:hypothetical protein FZC66_15650 [Priestia megaterium]